MVKRPYGVGSIACATIFTLVIFRFDFLPGFVFVLIGKRAVYQGLCFPPLQLALPSIASVLTVDAGASPEATCFTSGSGLISVSLRHAAKNGYRYICPRSAVHPAVKGGRGVFYFRFAGALERLSARSLYRGPRSGPKTQTDVVHDAGPVCRRDAAASGRPSVCVCGFSLGGDLSAVPPRRTHLPPT